MGFSAHPASGLRHDHHGPRVLGSERVVLSRSSSLLRPDPPVSPTPAAFPGSLVILRVFARQPGLGCQRDLPCFGSVLLLYVPSPLRREEERGTPVSPRYPWPSSTEHGVGSSTSPHTSCGEGFANDAAVFASCYGPQSCWPSWTGPTWRLLRPPRTFTPELARGQSPGPRVGYHYTALLGENCGRTFTGWSTAVTGCTFCRKVDSNSLLSTISGIFLAQAFQYMV